VKIAIGLPNAVPGTDGVTLVEWGRLAEAAGFSSLGTIGRVVFDGHEELVALSAVAGATKRIGLATTVMIGPVREPVLLAKQAATLDAISGGRLSLGLGVGWRDDDFRATGADHSKRGEALDRQIEVLRRVWSGEPPAAGLGPVGPTPARRGGPELLLGGSAPAALRRAGRDGDAYIAVPGPPDAVRQAFDAVREAAEKAGRERPPRLVAAAYFALGDARAQGEASMRAYYAAGGDEFVKVMLDRLVTTPDGIRRTLDGMREIGADETFLWSASAEPGQVHELAEIVR